MGGLGKTGTFPEGKLNKFDEGAIKIAIGTEKENVLIEFGTPVKWLAMPPEDAMKLAYSLLAQAKSLKNLV